MTVILTSFHETRADTMRFSGARWAPDFARDWPALEWAKPVHEGEYIRPRMFVDQPDPLLAYYKAMHAVYEYRAEEILAWADTLDPDQDYYVCCWCPHTKAARRQIGEFDSFVCHLGSLAKFFQSHNIPWAFGESHRSQIARVK